MQVRVRHLIGGSDEEGQTVLNQILHIVENL